jgi:hypothetical protein
MARYRRSGGKQHPKDITVSDHAGTGWLWWLRCWRRRFWLVPLHSDSYVVAEALVLRGPGDDLGGERSPAPKPFDSLEELKLSRAHAPANSIAREGQCYAQ